MEVISQTQNGAIDFKPGDHVGLKLGARYVHGTILEDRGPLASNGRRLYSVSVEVGAEPLIGELPEEELLERFPAEDIAVASAVEGVEEAINAYKSFVSGKTDNRNHLRGLRAHVKGEYKALLRALKETTRLRPSTDLDALEASIPPAMKKDVRGALVSENPPEIRDV